MATKAKNAKPLSARRNKIAAPKKVFTWRYVLPIGALALVLLAGVPLVHVLFPAANAAVAPVPYGIYFVGDSLTKGRSATTESQTFRKLVAGYKQTKLGAGYAVSDQFPNLTYTSGWKIANAQAAVKAYPPTSSTKLMVIEIGTNDLTGNQGTSPITPSIKFIPAYGSMIATLHKEAPQAKLVCISVWSDPTVGSKKYDTAIQSDCIAAGGKYVSIIGTYQTAKNHGPAGLPEDWYMPGWKTDTYHPNNAGQAAIATGIEAVL